MYAGLADNHIRLAPARRDQDSFVRPLDAADIVMDLMFDAFRKGQDQRLEVLSGAGQAISKALGALSADMEETSGDG